MKKFFASNNLGFSLITAIIALAGVTATTAYLISLSKNASVVSATAKSTTYLEAERSRISAALSNNNTCILDANFGGGQPAIRASITSLYTAVPPAAPAAQPLLITQGGEYYNKTLRIDSIQLRAAVASSPGVIGDINGADVGTDKGYILQINYLDTSPNNGRSSFIGKKQSVINIPMYMKVVAGNVVECYSLGQNNNIDQAIRATCSPASGASTKVSLKNLNSGNEADCEHSVIFTDPSPAVDTTTCTSTAASAPSTSTSLSGWDLTPGTPSTLGAKITIPGTKCSGIDTPTCSTAGQSSYSITDNIPACSYAGGIRDGACSSGQLLYHNSGTSTTCTTVNCPAAHSFINTITSAGASCFTAPTTTCGPNQYVKIFNSTGSDVCGILPTMSGTCGVGSFGISITRDNATANGTLNCAAYSKAKACPSPNAYTFATALGASSTATCASF